MAGVGDRRYKPPQSSLQVDCLHDAGIRTRIRIFRDLLASCRGSHGKAKAIQNSVGGHVTWTKISSRLFSAISLSTPVLKLMMTSFQAHLDRYKDGGLLIAQLCLSLVEDSLKLDLHKRLLIELYEEFTIIVDKYLNSDECECRFRVDVFDFNQVRTVLESICGPKLSHLNSEVQYKMCILFLDVFLSTIPQTQQDFYSDKVLIQCLENSSMSESTCLKGLLIQCPELSSFKEEIIQARTYSDPEGVRRIKVALVTESMSGDANSFIDAVYEIGVGVDTISVVVKKLLDLCEGLIQTGVGLLLCQRVIHPKVKAKLRQAGVMFVDRLGSQLIPYVKDITGAKPVSVLSSCPKESWDGFGWLESISHQIWSDKSYLLLKHLNLPIVTLVLKSNTEENLQELKTLSQTTVTSLRLLMREPWVFSGGGCWMSHVTAHLSQQVQKDMARLVEDLDCNRSLVIQALETFSRCLLSLATSATSDYRCHVTDTKHNHIWSSTHHMTGDKCLDSDVSEFTCCCGMVLAENVEKFEFVSEKIASRYTSDRSLGKDDSTKRFPKVVDSLCVVRNALKMSVATANTVLSISQFIHDPV